VTTSQLTFPAEVSSVPAARRFVRDSLIALGAVGACDDAELLVCELATNAVLHARTSFTVEVSGDGRTARICVHDLSPARPRTRDYGLGATTGRGMRLVASIAADWGVEQQGSGKTVWFALPVAGSTAPVPAWEDDIDVDALLAGFGDEDSAGPRAAAAT
jgi:anti-sigma regulatory factor (Ser/Thr protein kinase)